MRKLRGFLLVVLGALIFAAFLFGLGALVDWRTTHPDIGTPLGGSKLWIETMALGDRIAELGSEAEEDVKAAQEALDSIIPEDMAFGNLQLMKNGWDFVWHIEFDDGRTIGVRPDGTLYFEGDLSEQAKEFWRELGKGIPRYKEELCRDFEVTP